MGFTKKIITLSLLLISFFLLNCNKNNTFKKDSSKCKYVNNKTSELISIYRLTKDKTKLDSALILINNNINVCQEFKRLFFIRKLGILSLEKKYRLAIKQIDKINYDIFKQKKYYNKFLKYRFEAMDAENKNNKMLRDKYLKKIILLLKQYLASKQNKVDSLFSLNDLNKIYSNPINVEVSMFYYYKSKLIGKKKVIEELDNKYNSESVYVQDIIAFLDEDFMDFEGF